MSVEQVGKKVQRMLAEMFGSISIDSDGDFFVRFDSATVFVRVFETHAGTTMVRVFAVVLSGARLSDDLYRWVATSGQDYFFGHMQVVERENGSGLLLFEHHLLGDYVDPDELSFAVHAMGSVADDIDDELQQRFGGSTFNGR